MTMKTPTPATPPTPMNCEAVDAHLASWLEGELPRETREAVEAHLGECLRCAALVRDLSAIRRDAANLPVLEPSRDLWEGVAARIETPVYQLAASEDRGARRRQYLRQGLIAAGLVAVTAGVTYTLTLRTVTGTGVPLAAVQQADTALPRVVVSDTPAPSPSTQPAAPAGRGAGETPARNVGSATPVSNNTATIAYDREIMQLRVLVNQRRAELDPVTVAVVENSLTQIDRAILDARNALARDPASSFLTEQLNRALEKKLGVLRTAALLPSRI